MTDASEPVRRRVPDPGVLYLLTNPYMPGLCKIGRTSGDPAERARQLSTTGVPGRFSLTWHSRPLANHSSAERVAHERLAKYRVEGEFFKIEPSIAVQVLTAVEREYLDQVWLKAEDERRRAEARKREQRAAAFAAAQARHAALLRDLTNWSRRPEVVNAFQEASRHPGPFITRSDSPFAGCLYSFGLLVLLAMVAPLVVVFPPTIAAFAVFGLVLYLVGRWGESDDSRDQAARERRAAVWARVAHSTPPAIMEELARCNWEPGSAEAFRQKVEAERPTPPGS